MHWPFPVRRLSRPDRYPVRHGRLSLRTGREGWQLRGVREEYPSCLPVPPDSAGFGEVRTALSPLRTLGYPPSGPGEMGEAQRTTLFTCRLRWSLRLYVVGRTRRHSFSWRDYALGLQRPGFWWARDDGATRARFGAGAQGRYRCRPCRLPSADWSPV